MVSDERKIAAEVVDGRIHVVDHRHCKGCDCPSLFDLSWEEAAQFRREVHRALNALGDQRRQRTREEYAAELAERDRLSRGGVEREP